MVLPYIQLKTARPIGQNKLFVLEDNCLLHKSWLDGFELSTDLIEIADSNSGYSLGKFEHLKQEYTDHTSNIFKNLLPGILTKYHNLLF